MAIKIAVDNVVNIIKPYGDRFDLYQLNEHVNGFVEPIKVGPVWVMYQENSKLSSGELNMVASFFFGFEIYGDVLVVPPQQLPSDWVAMDPDDYNYTSQDVDSGFILSLQRALIYRRVYGNPEATDNINRLMNQFDTQEEWVYRPPDIIDENTQNFYQQVFEHISQISTDDIGHILLETSGMVVKTETTDDYKKTLSQMISLFSEREEYEKCTVIKNIYEQIPQ